MALNCINTLLGFALVLYWALDSYQSGCVLLAMVAEPLFGVQPKSNRLFTTIVRRSIYRPKAVNIYEKILLNCLYIKIYLLQRFRYKRFGIRIVIGNIEFCYEAIWSFNREMLPTQKFTLK